MNDGADDIKIAATCVARYSYRCENCKKLVAPEGIRLEYESKFTPSIMKAGGRGQKSTFNFNPADVESARKAATKTFKGMTETIDRAVADAVSERRQVVMYDEPFLIRHFNRMFKAGDACPHCGARQSWYPAVDRYVGLRRERRNIAVMLGLFLLAVAFAVIAPFYFTLNTVAVAVAGGVLVLVYVGLVISLAAWRKANRERARRSFKRVGPEIEWGVATARVEGAEAIIEEDEFAFPDEMIRRDVSIDASKIDSLMCYRLKHLKHVNVLNVIDVTPDAYGGLTITEEKFDGMPLSDFLFMDVSESAFQDIVLQLCDALTYLHEQKPPVTHNAVTLDNIIVGEDNLLKLTSYELATIDTPPDNDIAMLGKIVAQVGAKFAKRYRKIVSKCANEYTTVEEFRTEFLKASRSNYLRIVVAIVPVIFALLMLRRVVGRILPS